MTTHKQNISDILKKRDIYESIYKDSAGLGQFLELYKNNEILYYMLSLLNQGRRLPETVSKIIAEEEALYRNTLEVNKDIDSAFQDKDLKYFAMKTFRSYPYADGDIDTVIVERDRLHDYVEALETIGYLPKFNRSSLREPAKSFFVKRKADNTISLPKVHLHRLVSWNGIEFLDANGIWLRLRTINIMDSNVKVPSVEDEILIMSAHTMYENGYVTIGELIHIKNLLSGTDTIDVEYMDRTSRQYRWGRSLRLYLSYIDFYYKLYTGEGLLPKHLKQALHISSISEGSGADSLFPFFLPMHALLGAYRVKIMKELSCFNMSRIPRHIFSLLVVVWLFRVKKRARFMKKA